MNKIRFREISLIVLLLTISPYVFAKDELRVNSKSVQLDYHEKKDVTFRVVNLSETKIENVSVEIISKEGIEVALMDNDVFDVFPDNNREFHISVQNNIRTIFKKEHVISLVLHYKNSTTTTYLTVYSKPPVYVWPLFGFFIIAILSLVLLKIFKIITQEDHHDQ